MRKYITLFFSVLAVLCACNDKQPQGIIDQEEMTGLLVDLHLADGSLMMVSSAQDSLYKYGTGRFLNVFKRHHTDSASFNKSYRYYSANAGELLKIYDEVTKRLQKKTDSLNKVLQKETEKAAKKDNARPMLKQQGKPVPPVPDSVPPQPRKRIRPDSIKKGKNVIPQ